MLGSRVIWWRLGSRAKTSITRTSLKLIIIITLHGIFLSLQSFIAFIFATRVHVAQEVLMISFEILPAFLEREYNKINWRWRLNYNYYCFSWLTFLVLNIKNINWPVIENSRERCNVKNIIPQCKHCKVSVYFIAVNNLASWLVIEAF